jgi:predicted lactoylglutathione lyase
VPIMEQRISLITLGVTDLAAARRFYESLGWQGQQVQETVFFQTGGSGLVLWGREKLAADAGIGDDEGARFGGVVLAHNVRSAAEVEEVLRQAAGAGATITRAAGETFYGGYAGSFRDLDGHVWEVAWNAGFPLADDGSIVIPDLDTDAP